MHRWTIHRVPSALAAALIAGLLAGSAVAAPGAAGYDPAADPASDLAAAVQRARAEGKHILLEVGGEWCVWCHRLERFVHDTASVRERLETSFVVVKVNMSPENENGAFLSRYPSIAGYPHLFVLDADGTLLHSQGTGELESNRSYDEARFLEFLDAWTP